jgi:hypothetical protein
MISRREVLQGGVLIASVPLVPTALADPSLYRVLFDQRFAASRDFGARAQWQGHAVRGFNGDITNVWFEELRPKWKHGPAAIAGLTTHSEELPSDSHESLYSWVIS